MDSKSEMARTEERRVRRKLVGSMDEAKLAVADDVASTSMQLSGHVLAIILDYLPLKDIMRSRRVCSDWKEAAKEAFISSVFQIESVNDYRALEMMTTALPNLQHLTIKGIIDRPPLVLGTRDHFSYWIDFDHKFADGDNPDELFLSETAHYRTHDVGIISNFQNLRSLTISDTTLNGVYPALFNFPLLENLTIDLFEFPNYIKWNFEMLEGLPMLRALHFSSSEHLNGNLKSLTALQDTLENVKINGCRNVVGDFMDLAHFPRLKSLDLRSTSVTGDIRDIGELDFKVLEELFLPRGVYGGSRYAFQSIAEVPDFMSKIYPLAKRFSLGASWRLSNESPDWYDDPNGVMNQIQRQHYQIPPPFVCELVTLGGTRIGWRWRCSFANDPMDDADETYFYDDYPTDYVDDLYVHQSCEINWLEPEPCGEDYTLQLRSLEEGPEIYFYRDFHNPPTEDEYRKRQLCIERYGFLPGGLLG